MAQMLTANRLIDGAVLYWKDGGWVEHLADAENFADSAEADAALDAAKADVAANRVINPYLFAVNGAQPASRREIIRAGGPSVRPDAGRQRHV
jgi:hypothetical protein